jgi:6-phosphogluconolactonase
VNNIIISPTKSKTIESATGLFLDCYTESIQERGYFSVVLSGGSTPKPLYEYLSYVEKIEWDKVFVFWGDERIVPSDHQASNYRLAYNSLLSRVSIPEENVFRIKGELSPESAANKYNNALDSFFDSHEKKFDLIILGMGIDGHTASLFPGSDALQEENRWVVPNYIPKLDSWRITLTYPAINLARKIIVLVVGEEKAKILKTVLEEDEDNDNLPIKHISSSNKEITWMIDREAGRFLSLYNT